MILKDATPMTPLSHERNSILSRQVISSSFTLGPILTHLLTKECCPRLIFIKEVAFYNLETLLIEQI